MKLQCYFLKRNSQIARTLNICVLRYLRTCFRKCVHRTSRAVGSTILWEHNPIGGWYSSSCGVTASYLPPRLNHKIHECCCSFLKTEVKHTSCVVQEALPCTLTQHIQLETQHPAPLTPSVGGSFWCSGFYFQPQGCWCWSPGGDASEHLAWCFLIDRLRASYQIFFSPNPIK